MTNSKAMIDALTLSVTGTDIFGATHQVIPSGRAYGGEVVAQAVTAALNTVDPDRTIHSFHGYFLRAGDVNEPSEWAVERVRDGRGFSVRAVTGRQLGREIFRGTASFHVPERGVAHQDELSAGLPDPETLPTAGDALCGSTVRDAEYWSAERNFDIRHTPPAVYVDAGGERVRRQTVWLKAYDRLPDDPNLHRAALAYLCDYTLLEPVLRYHGAAWADDGVVTASLDHAMWWYADGRVDEWIALVQESPVAGGGLALTRASIFSREGVLLASVAQEGLVRLPAA
ncbi:acyl-CoA thioesterase [Nocardia arthritidis]|uniref:Acyl-CoA thioesterase II n=1 Tax=Nocardia arthritidis TaxID=228602 RepID=A0A6G9Y4I5_9NOCA|nr:acyl-CoA thioesterase domain-containing protein [Nocardia arthritidis]QIS07986.1 acyl-CoA thioesterase II [Nocardia arthritidis]